MTRNDAPPSVGLPCQWVPWVRATLFPVPNLIRGYAGGGVVYLPLLHHAGGQGEPGPRRLTCLRAADRPRHVRTGAVDAHRTSGAQVGGLSLRRAGRCRGPGGDADLDQLRSCADRRRCGDRIGVLVCRGGWGCSSRLHRCSASESDQPGSCQSRRTSDGRLSGDPAHCSGSVTRSTQSVRSRAQATASAAVACSLHSPLGSCSLCSTWALHRSP